MTRLDWIVLGVVIGTALLGLWQGFMISALSAAGVIVGAIVGARLAPIVLTEGSESPYTPLIALLGAAAMAVVLELVGSSLGIALRRRLPQGGFRTVDSVGGLVVGAVAGLAVVWVLAAVAVQVPGRHDLVRQVQRSVVLRELNAIVPPRDALRALARVDPFPSITGPLPPVGPPDPRILRRPGVRRAAPSVVRVLGTACGFGVSGSGWVARRNLVVTNAHVVAGQTDTTVDSAALAPLPAEAVAFDTRNDIAILRVPGLNAPALRAVDAREGDPVAILGYPEDGPLDARAGRVGRTTRVFSEDAYGDGPVRRLITSVRGTVRHGNSGGPLVNEAGNVEGTIFAARVDGGAGYAVPAAIVRRALATARRPVSTGNC